VELIVEAVELGLSPERERFAKRAVDQGIVARGRLKTGPDAAVEPALERGLECLAVRRVFECLLGPCLR
jgi:hypothetical protein